MKKLLKASMALFMASVLSFSAFADRFVELGLNTGLGIDQNFMGASEIFKKEVVIDLPKIAKSMGPDGFVLNAYVVPNLFLNVNVGEAGGGLDFGLTGRVNASLSKEIFELLAYGNEVDEEVTSRLKANAQLYVDVSVPVKFKIGAFKVKVTPSVFVPIVYMPNPDATVKTKITSDGSAYAVASGSFDIYSVFDTSCCVVPDGAGGTTFDTSQLNNIMSSSDSTAALASAGGFDLGGEVTMPFILNLTLGGYAHIPLVPGRLGYKTSGSATVSGNVDEILNTVVNGSSGGDSSEPMYTIDGPTYSDITTTAVKFNVNRPLRFGGMVSWTPFGNWCVFSGALGFAADNPFGADFVFKEKAYVEYKFGVDATVLYVLGFSFTSEYTEKVFIQNFGFRFNLRVLEIDGNVGFSSTSFIKSFTGAGLYGKVGFIVGF